MGISECCGLFRVCLGFFFFSLLFFFSFFTLKLVLLWKYTQCESSAVFMLRFQKLVWHQLRLIHVMSTFVSQFSSAVNPPLSKSRCKIRAIGIGCHHQICMRTVEKLDVSQGRWPKTDSRWNCFWTSRILQPRWLWFQGLRSGPPHSSLGTKTIGTSLVSHQSQTKSAAAHLFCLCKHTFLHRQQDEWVCGLEVIGP